MVTGLSHTFSTVGAPEDIPRALRRAIRAVDKGGTSPRGDLPDNVARVVGFGRKVWKLLERRAARRTADEPIDELVAELEALGAVEDRQSSAESD